MAMRDLALWLAEEVVIAVTVTGVGVLLAARSRQVGASWAAGVVWIAARTHRPAAPVWLPRAVRAAGWWLLTRALRAHGKHRAGVA